MDKEVLIALIGAASTVAAAVIGGLASRSPDTTGSATSTQGTTYGSSMRRRVRMRRLVQGAVVVGCIGVLMIAWAGFNRVAGGVTPHSSGIPLGQTGGLSTAGPSVSTGQTTKPPIIDETPEPSRSPTSATLTTAKLGLVRVWARTVLDSTSPKKVLATCPSGKQITGGGGWADDKGRGQTRLTGLEPQQLSNGRQGYLVSASEPAAGFTAGWRLEAYAICADPIPGHAIVSHSADSSSATFVLADATCPSGTLAIGTGGTVSNGNGEVGLQLSRPTSTAKTSRTTGREDADGYAGTWTLTAHVICANKMAGLEDSGGITAGGDYAYTCPAGTWVHSVSGGGGLTDFGPYWLQRVYPSEDLRSIRVSMTAAAPEGMAAGAFCGP